MKLTEREIDLFKSLNGSEMGNSICDYLERLQTFICDARNWGPHDTKESSQKVAEIIQKNLVDKIKLQTKPKDIDLNQYT